MTAARIVSMKALSLFSGIGGLDLAAESCGIETAAFCEIEPYAVEVLKRRWPSVPIINDVRKIRGCEWAVDVVHGGFPCQDLSVAGKQRGLSGDRSDGGISIPLRASPHRHGMPEPGQKAEVFGKRGGTGAGETVLRGDGVHIFPPVILRPVWKCST
jgi:hypothetical protein